jgi:hypothetical protein
MTAAGSSDAEGCPGQVKMSQILPPLDQPAQSQPDHVGFGIRRPCTHLFDMKSCTQVPSGKSYPSVQPPALLVQRAARGRSKCQQSCPPWTSRLRASRIMSALESGGLALICLTCNLAHRYLQVRATRQYHHRLYWCRGLSGAGQNVRNPAPPGPAGSEPAGACRLWNSEALHSFVSSQTLHRGTLRCYLPLNTISNSIDAESFPGQVIKSARTCHEQTSSPVS